MGTDEDRKRVIGIIAGILMARHLDRVDDLFGGRGREAQRTDKMIAAGCSSLGDFDYEEG